MIDGAPDHLTQFANYRNGSRRFTFGFKPVGPTAARISDRDMDYNETKLMKTITFTKARRAYGGLF